MSLSVNWGSLLCVVVVRETFAAEDLNRHHGLDDFGAALQRELGSAESTAKA